MSSRKLDVFLIHTMKMWFAGIEVTGFSKAIDAVDTDEGNYELDRNSMTTSSRQGTVFSYA